MKTKASFLGGSEGESWWFFWMLFSRNASTDWWEIKRCLQHRAFWNVAEFELFGTWKGAGIPHKKCWEVHPYFFLQRGQKGQAEVAPLGLAANGFPKIPPFDGLFYLWNFEWFCLEYVCFNRYWMILFSSISRDLKCLQDSHKTALTFDSCSENCGQHILVCQGMSCWIQQKYQKTIYPPWN